MSNKTEDDIFGGMEFLHKHMNYLIPYITLYILVAIFGVFGMYGIDQCFAYKNKINAMHLYSTGFVFEAYKTFFG